MSGQRKGSGARRGRRGPVVAIVVVASVVIVACAAVAIAVGIDRRSGSNTVTTPLEELAEQSERVDIDESSGIVYVNNEILVYTTTDADPDEAKALFSSVGASDVDETMADIGLYRLVFSDAMSYEELNSVVETLSESPLVDTASIDPVSTLENDDAGAEGGEGEAAAPQPVTPDDPWNNASWDVDVPRDENWGMEAIDAPGAWAYLDQLSDVRLGLIDTPPKTDHPDLDGSLADCTYLLVDDDAGTISEAPAFAAEDHGTHVAGIMAAEYNNGSGVSGVTGGKGSVSYCAVFYQAEGGAEQRYGTAYSYLLEVDRLLDQNVRAINISQNTNRLIGFAASRGNQNALNYLQKQADLFGKGLARIVAQRQAAGLPDFVICVAAGNSNTITYYPDANETYGYRTEPKWSESPANGEVGNSLAVYNNFISLADEESVRDRVIVVGSVDIDPNASTSSQTRLEYSDYSCVGDRVDVVAPGGNNNGSLVYSCGVSQEYLGAAGTSMATPHVTGVAGLVFAANPELSGPDVKRIVVASGDATSRYYHGSSWSTLVDARTAVESALRTREESVSRVVANNQTNGLDLCFVVDTTGSMGDDIDNARQNMEQILSNLATRTENYRVALVDYRDFASRTRDSDDYASKVQLDFTNDDAAITAAIDQLDLGYGGDNEETVYSGLMQAVNLGWRDDAKKVVIILGDAAPLDPEPSTGYTYEDVALALFNGGIGIDYTSSDSRVLGTPDESLINVYSIGADASSDALDFFEDISSSTGGSSADIDDASGVSDAITSSIDQIEVEAGVTAELDFGGDMAGHRVDLYAATGTADAVTDSTDSTGAGEKDDGPTAGTYLFSFTTDESGRFTLDALPAGSYVWTTDGPSGGGTLSVATGGTAPALSTSGSFWFSPVTRAWDRAAPLIVSGLLVLLALCVAAPLVIVRLAAPHRPGRPGGGGGPRRCPYCGGEIPAGARFCRHCGRTLG
ncbi:S8 family serine peptidase [Olsenella uli]|uniref:S8 family serine peptidase n=1 Tax=Olsenella uli TaxID=133926 RepID=UPI001957ABDB|nr:S8 family serine peptidase [Olsenella uli]MBM6676284.1 S8 family serine peptidase [Olsenella uli]